MELVLFLILTLLKLVGAAMLVLIVFVVFWDSLMNLLQRSRR